VEKTWKHFELCEAECRALLEKYAESQNPETTHPEFDKRRFPLLAAYDLCLKCSHLFNILDARGAISVTERVGVIARVRALAVGIAKAWVDQQAPAREPKDEAEPALEKKPRIKKEKMEPVGS
jgi:glycyl-tRNA synthetase alpha chain